MLTLQEVLRLLDHLRGENLLMAKLIYGCGLRIMECMRLCVRGIDFEPNALTLRTRKRDKDRETLLPEGLKDELQTHLEKVYRLY